MINMAQAVQAYAELDQVGVAITPRLKTEYARQFRDAVLKYGSIPNMPEPFRSWCLDPDDIPDEYLMD